MPKFRPSGKVESVIISGMIFPKKVPGLKWLLVMTAVYGIIWMGLEGNLGRVIVMGTAVSLVSTGYLMERFLAGRVFQWWGWLVVMGGGGALAGFGSGLLAFVFMALKTGLHGHGPEFQAAEIELVLGMVPIWGVAGLVAGVGLGVLLLGFRKDS